MKKLSIVVPCYNEEDSLLLFYNELKKSLEQLKIITEILFVDDGSCDNTLKVIKDLSSKETCIRYISFSKNFGKEAALLAGLSNVDGDYVVIMDADLQDPPKLLKEMMYWIENDNYDIVGTRRVTRKGEPIVRSFFARCFYKIINKISNIELVDGARNFRLMKKQVVDSILQLQECNRFSNGIFSYVGFKTKWLEYENVARIAGETKWSFWKLFLYAIEGIVSFSTVPLFASILFSILFFIISIFLITLFIFYTSNALLLIISIIFFISSIVMISLGIIGIYLAKLYIEIKGRPKYIIKESNMVD